MALFDSDRLYEINPVRLTDILAGREPIIADPSPQPEMFELFGIRFLVAVPLVRPTDERVIVLPGQAEIEHAERELGWTQERDAVGIDAAAGPDETVVISAESIEQAMSEQIVLSCDEVLARLYGEFAVMPEMIPDADYFPGRRVFTTNGSVPPFTWDREIVFTRRVPVSGDDESAVDPGAITELVAFAKAGNKEDFMILAGAVGVAHDQREAMWSGTRQRLGLGTTDL